MCYMCHQTLSHNKRTNWRNREVKREIKNKKQACKKYIQTKSERDKEEYNRLRRISKNTIKDAKKETWKTFGKEL